ncbi:G-box-binding factor [Folsomia candida]|uniref:G-box-binding factor n=1 Tax=Folsomia candida TaxID=158441 RepID=UPI000B8FFADA|nr:G-box-binding factor [Folsomia candida]
MTQYIALLVTLSLTVVATVAQDAAYQQGLSLHNQQIQEHLRKEAEQQRSAGQSGASHAPQNHYQQQQPQYFQQQQQAAPQQQYQGGEDDGQYRPELYNNPNNFARSNPEQVYQEGIKAHQAQIQAHLQKEGRFQPQANQIGDPIYQQGLQLHQRQIQDHLQKEQQLGGPAPQAYHQPQQRAYQPQAAPAPQYQNQGFGGQNNGAQEFQQGIQLHMQQLLEHQRQQQQHQAQVGQASQYHQSQQPRSY